MPQNAIIRANGTGDYTSPQAWAAGEQGSNYGTITIGRVDGFFDFGAVNLDINGLWVNGARLECFDSPDSFDGTRRSLCGFTGTASQTVRNRANDVELSGLEVYNTLAGTPYSNTNSGGDFYAQDCLFKSGTNVSAVQATTTTGQGLINCVLDSDRGYNPQIKTSNTSVFGDTASSMGASSMTGVMSNTVTVNIQSGACYRATITQSNNASTDATADFLDNIVVADNFESATPAASGDYRIKAGSDLDTNGIGAFIQSAAGSVIPVIMNQLRSQGIN